MIKNCKERNKSKPYKRMILRQYYEQKKEKIDSIVNDGNDDVRIGLYSDRIFDQEDDDKPVIMFKYNDVVWNTSSEQEYKADVDFSIYIALNNKFEEDYIESFELARQVDEVILLSPTRADLQSANTGTELIKNSAFKVRERQYTVEEDHWKKNNYYIWEIQYKTTLIEKEYKKRYAMITNQAFSESYLANNEDKVRENLRKLGYDLDDYNKVEYNGQELLVFNNVKEKLVLNNDKEVTLKRPKKAKAKKPKK